MVVIAVDAGGEAMSELGLFSPELLKIMTANATATAADRAAEMVGMRWDGTKLIQNPDAKWRIDEATRDMVRSTATEAVEGGWSNDRLASALADAHAFSEARAMNIARTETSRAQNDGAIAGWKATGVVGGREWSVGEGCCDECEEYEGVIVALDEEFEEGDPPLHPSCRCSLLPILIEDMPGYEPDDTDNTDQEE